jgi:mercuric ion transport protein
MKNEPKNTCNCSKKVVQTSKKMSTLNIVSAVVFFLFPKCPICWAAYASFFSFIGMEQFEYHSYWRYIVLSVFLLGSAFLLWRHYQNKSWLNIILYVSGLSLLLTVYYLNYKQIGWLIIVALLMLGSNFHLPKKSSISL